jgi:hypothetical protein
MYPCYSFAGIHQWEQSNQTNSIPVTGNHDAEEHHNNGHDRSSYSLQDRDHNNAHDDFDVVLHI